MNAEEWKACRLGDAVEINRASIKESSPPANELAYVDLSSVKDGHVTVPKKRSKIEDLPSRARRLFARGDVLMAMVRPNLLGSAYVDFEPENCVCSTGFAVLTPKAGVDGRLIYQNLVSSHFIFQYFAYTVGSSYPALNSTDVQSLHLALPPYPEQSKIADILEIWDKGAKKLRALTKSKQERKRSLMQKLLSGEKRLPGFTETWQEVRLGDILKHVFRPLEWAPDKILHLVSIRRRSGGLFRRAPVRGDEYKTKDLHEIHEGDFLISKRQVSHGALAMVRKDFHGCHVSKEYTILENKDPARLHMPFFDWLSRTKRMWWLTYVASNGVVIEKLIFAPQDFLKFTIKIPPTIEEQERIVELLETCDREIALHRRQLEAIREQKRGLMQKLLTGEVRVKVDQENP